MLSGRCLCGTVRYEIDGQLGPAIFCHCSQCRRASGTAFATNAPVRARYLRFVTGREAITEYASSPGKLRAFCSRCGSPVYSRLEADPETFRIRLGLLDGDPGRVPLAHFWASAKAPWHEIAEDSLPRYPGGAPIELHVREERAEDFAAIDRIHEEAFRQPGEARLVRALRDEARPYVGLVAEREQRVVGHIAFSPVAIEGGSPPAMGLGPVGVAPGVQRDGIGRALVHAGLAACAAGGAQIVVVLGHAEYYPRFGFRPASPLGLRYRSETFDPSFFALELIPGALDGVHGWVRYHPAFERL
jgi:putative acetyltransferase